MSNFHNLSDLITRLVTAGATRIFFKPLSENDNSKQQIYLGGNFEVLTFFPYGEVVSYPKVKVPNFKADVQLFWVSPSSIERAPHAQLILYPKYPEVRLSGFLRGCRTAPNEHLRPIPREERKGKDGRVLFFGTTDDGRTLVYLAPAGSPLALDATLAERPKVFDNLFVEIPIPGRDGNSSRVMLLDTLREIHQRGLVESMRLDRHGNAMPYTARNGGGYTLEAMLGIRPNGDAMPDFLGWEVKAFSGSRITLMTPEPNGGMYGREGVESFVRKYGHPVEGKDQLYFTGVHRYGIENSTTALKLELKGYDATAGKIVDVSGSIQLSDEHGENTASWAFAHLLTHWNRKHASAVYVEYENNKATPPQYRYLSPVSLGEHTDFAKCLGAIARGKVVFDPGSKVDEASTAKSKVKARSQFRINRADLPALYEKFEVISL
jgi:hypothetical protein